MSKHADPQLSACPICGEGRLGLRRCGVCRRVVALCRECDAAWPDPAQACDPDGLPPTLAARHETPCPGCRACLWGNGAAWVGA